MKKINVIARVIAVVFFAIAVVPAAAQQAQGGAAEYQLHTEHLDSAVLKEKRTITIQLPKSYATQPNKKYPVIYRLDGKENLPLISK